MKFWSTEKCFISNNNNLKNTKILFIFFLFFTPKNNWKDKKLSFWPKLFRNNQFNEFHHIFCFKVIKMMKATIWEWIKSIENNWFFSIWLFWMKVVCVELSFQLMNFNFFIWLILSNWGIPLNYQRHESEQSIWLKSSFLSIEKIIFFQMNYQFL